MGHDITGLCMQLLLGLCCFYFVSDIPLLQLLWLVLLGSTALAISSWRKRILGKFLLKLPLGLKMWVLGYGMLSGW